MKRKGLTKALAVALSVAMVGTSAQPAASTVYAAELADDVLTVNTSSEGEQTSDEALTENEDVKAANEDKVDDSKEDVEDTDSIIEEETKDTDSEEKESEEEELEDEESEEETKEEDSLEEEEDELSEEEKWILETANNYGISKEDAASLKEDIEGYIKLVNDKADFEDIEELTVELTQKYTISDDELNDLVFEFIEYFDWEINQEPVQVLSVDVNLKKNLTYKDFNEDEVVAEYKFGTDVKADSEAFSKVEYNEAAKGWDGGVYYPRVAKVTNKDASYVSEADGALKISSKVWTETESSGYGVYTYENTSSFDVELDNADYTVEVTFVNPTGNTYTAYIESEDITKVTGISVAPGETVKKSFTACLVDGNLNIKFLAESSATSEGAAETKDVYVSNVKITRKATNAQYENDGVKKPTVFIASDSTVQSYESNYYPQTGWGQVLAEFMGDGEYKEVTSANAGYSQSKTYETSTVVVENRAIGGRSSSSFITEGKYDDLLEDVAPGDFVLVQWGHNDATASRPNRYVSSSDFEKWIQYYVDGAIQRGATPILVTPVARYSYTTDSDGNLKTYASNFEAYRQVMIKMSKEQGIALVDLTARSIELANSFGIDGGKSLWLHVNAGDYTTGAYAGGASDSTHLQWYGAYKFAQCVAQGILEITGVNSYATAGSSYDTHDYKASEEYISSDNKDALKKLTSQIDLRKASTVPGTVNNITLGAVGASSASMSWDADSEAELYYVYRAEVSSEEEALKYKFSDDAVKLSVSRNNKYTDSTCKSGKTYVYAIRSFNSLGLGDFSENVVVSTKSAGLRFDFNYNNSTTQEGWTGIEMDTDYSSETGYGWIKSPKNGRSRGNNGTVGEDLADMAGDFSLGEGEFAVDLPNGDYELTIYAADLMSGTSTIKPYYYAEGDGIGGISCKQSLGSVTGVVRVTDGQLNLTIGGTNSYINGFTITELLLAPTSLVDTEASVSGSKYSFLIGFNGVKEAAGYNVYRKGTTDKEFVKVKTFTAQEYKDSELDCRAMSCNLGENYEYYVTCYTSDGTESAPSNTIVVKAQLDVATPAAPKNVVCVSPTKDATAVQNEITLKWDESEIVDTQYPVIKYIVYRSDKAENAKGFTEFKKIGETTETTFTDTDENLATNIHYYYKVCASNAGGAGELSEVCETPVTGSLVAGNVETLTDRALVAIGLSDSVKGYDTNGSEITKGVYLSWRAFEEEFDSKNKLTTKFDVYCNGTKIASDISVTNMVYEGGKAGDVFKVVGTADSKVNGGLKVIETTAREQQYIEAKLNKPEPQTLPSGDVTDFTANDMSVGDVDGDGVLELIVKWYPNYSKDNSGSGYTGTTIIDTYDIDWATGEAKLLSRIDLGINIRSGAHYTQFQVWDFDGDGKAELAVKTADGTTSYDSELKEVAYVGACSMADLDTAKISDKNDYRNTSGYILDGPEYFSIFNLDDGTKAAEDVNYIPSRGTVSKWGDAYGNRVDRFLSATAYLDGVHPFAVMCRGYYTRTAITAYGMKDTNGDGIADTIYTYWAYDTDNGDGPEGQGNHNLAVADVDNDGKDEIVYGSSCYDNDGTLKYSTDLGHGDAMHVSDWISWNDGLEVMEVHEEANREYQVEIHDAETGEVLIGYPVANADVGRGVAADIDPTSVGAEFWASKAADGQGTGEWDSVDSAVYGTEKSNTTYWDMLTSGSTPAVNAMLYWDGDLLAEIQDHTFNKDAYAPLSVVIADWDYLTGKQVTLIDSSEILSSNGTKGNLGLIADLTGDWREEFIARCAKDDSSVRVYNTTFVTDYVVPCLLDDLQYREGVAWENVAYNQPTHSSYLISKGLVTASIAESEVETDSVTLKFTKANDGTLYGHEITAYEIYRDGELIDTVAVDKLGKADSASQSEAVEKPEEISKIEYKFDFGAEAVADGYTQVTASDLYSEEKGYGFVDADGTNGKWSTATASTKGCIQVNESDDLDKLADRVLFTASAEDLDREFEVKVPNGKYQVSVTIAGVNVYNAVSVEGQEVGGTSFRFGNNGAYATKTAEIEVTDGVMNFVVSASNTGRSYYIDFTEISIVETDENYEAREKEYNEALAKYEAYVAAQESNEASIDENYGVVKYEYKFDFGAGAVEEGYTQVTASDLYSEEKGYGFTSTENLSNKAYKTWTEDEKAALLNDSVLGWISSGSFEFDAKVENATYEVTYYIANGSGNVYNKVTAEGVEFTDVRRGRSDIQATSETKTVTVEDGIINIINTVSRNNSPSNYFTGITIVETEESFASRVAAAKTAYEKENANNDSDAMFVYTDKNVSSNTEYSYQIAAVVDGHSTYKSKAAKATTLIKIAKVNDIILKDIVSDTEVTTDASELLPTTVEVIDEDGNKQNANVTWDVSKVDLSTAGEYTVYAKVAGFKETIECKLVVVQNEVKGVASIDTVKTIIGTEVKLPATVDVEFTNGSKKTVEVEWDAQNVDNSTLGEYTVEGTIKGFEETKASVLVKVVEDYPVSVDAASIEVVIGDTIVKNLPTTVVATMASGSQKEVAVTWKTTGVDDIDTSSVSSQIVHGSVENLDADILCNVFVRYKALYKFDFGIDANVVADGWTGVTVNPKGGEKTNAELGIIYSKEKGYGFLGLDENERMEGRNEGLTGSGLYPTKFVTDFALVTGKTFVVDVPNGDYSVEVITSCNIGSSSMKVDVEGTSASFSCNKSYTAKVFDVTVSDGQLTIADSGSTSRCAGIVVRQIKVADGTTTNEGNNTQTGDSNQSSSSNDNTGSSSQNTSSDSSSSSSDAQAVSFSSVIAADVDTQVINGVTAMSFNLDAKKILKMKTFENYHSQAILAMLNVGNGIGFTIMTNTVSANVKDVNLSGKRMEVLDFAPGFITHKYVFDEPQALTFSIGFNMNLGKELAGYNAYLFVYDAATKSYVQKKIMKVNEIGNVGLELTDLTEVWVLIEE